MKIMSTLGVVFSCLVVAHSQSTTQLARVDIPAYSAKATTIYAGKGVSSPDGKKLVTIALFDESADGFPAKITVTTEQGQLAATIQFGLDAEVLWSPDSNSFAVTGSLQSANGPFQTDVFAIHGDQLERVSISRLITLTFGHPVKCGWPESPNVGAIRWVVPSQQILVAAEIVHHSNCDSFGTFKAYTVELAGPRILKTYNQLQTKRLFASDLGEELIQANDKCIRDPRSCYVPANHEEPAPDLH